MRTGYQPVRRFLIFGSHVAVFVHVVKALVSTRMRNSGDCQHGCCVPRGEYSILTMGMRVRHADGETQEERQLCESFIAAMDNPPAAPIAQPAAAPPADAVPLALGAP